MNIFKDKKLLIIDDDVNFCYTLASILYEKGYRVECISTGIKAMQKVKEFMPDLIILDFLIPGVNGIELCEQIRKDRKTESIPILMISGDDKESVKADSFIAGADEFLAKPIDTDRFLNSLEEILSS